MALFVNLDSRYQMAWLEVTTRITQRQNSLYIFIVLSLGIAGFAFSDKSLDLQIIGLLVFAIPLSAIILGMLNQKHDQTIALLRRFLAECEVQGADPLLKDLAYNANARFRSYADKYRQNHKRAFCASILGMCGGAYVLLWLRVDPSASLPHALIVSYSILYVGACIWALLYVFTKPELDIATLAPPDPTRL